MAPHGCCIGSEEFTVSEAVECAGICPLLSAQVLLLQMCMNRRILCYKQNASFTVWQQIDL
jgi:hypothetical protein